MGIDQWQRASIFRRGSVQADASFLEPGETSRRPLSRPVPLSQKELDESAQRWTRARRQEWVIPPQAAGLGLSAALLAAVIDNLGLHDRARADDPADAASEQTPAAERSGGAGGASIAMAGAEPGAALDQGGSDAGVAPRGGRVDLASVERSMAPGTTFLPTNILKGEADAWALRETTAPVIGRAGLLAEATVGLGLVQAAEVQAIGGADAATLVAAQARAIAEAGKAAKAAETAKAVAQAQADDVAQPHVPAPDTVHVAPVVVHAVAAQDMVSLPSQVAVAADDAAMPWATAPSVLSPVKADAPLAGPLNFAPIGPVKVAMTPKVALAETKVDRGTTVSDGGKTDWHAGAAKAAATAPATARHADTAQAATTASHDAAHDASVNLSAGIAATAKAMVPDADAAADSVSATDAGHGVAPNPVGAALGTVAGAPDPGSSLDQGKAALAVADAGTTATDPTAMPVVDHGTLVNAVGATLGAPAEAHEPATVPAATPVADHGMAPVLAAVVPGGLIGAPDPAATPANDHGTALNPVDTVLDGAGDTLDPASAPVVDHGALPSPVGVVPVAVADTLDPGVATTPVADAAATADLATTPADPVGTVLGSLTEVLIPDTKGDQVPATPVADAGTTTGSVAMPAADHGTLPTAVGAMLGGLLGQAPAGEAGPAATPVAAADAAPPADPVGVVLGGLTDALNPDTKAGQAIDAAPAAPVADHAALPATVGAAPGQGPAADPGPVVTPVKVADAVPAVDPATPAGPVGAALDGLTDALSPDTKADQAPVKPVADAGTSAADHATSPATVGAAPSQGPAADPGPVVTPVKVADAVPAVGPATPAGPVGAALDSVTDALNPDTKAGQAIDAAPAAPAADHATSPATVGAAPSLGPAADPGPVVTPVKVADAVPAVDPATPAGPVGAALDGLTDALSPDTKADQAPVKPVADAGTSAADHAALPATVGAAPSQGPAADPGPAAAPVKIADAVPVEPADAAQGHGATATDMGAAAPAKVAVPVGPGAPSAPSVDLATAAPKDASGPFVTKPATADPATVADHPADAIAKDHAAVGPASHDAPAAEDVVASGAGVTPVPDHAEPAGTDSFHFRTVEDGSNDTALPLILTAALHDPTSAYDTTLDMLPAQDQLTDPHPVLPDYHFA